MTTYCVSSVIGAGGTGTGASWTNAYLSIAAALNKPVVAGDVVLVDNAHSFTANAAITYVPPAGRIAIISVTPDANHATQNYTAWTAGATENIGTSASGITFNSVANASWYINGVNFNGSSSNGNGVINFGSNSNNPTTFWFENCTFDLPVASSSNPMNTATGGNNLQKLVFLSCTFKCTGSNNAGAYFIAGNIELINPTFSFTGTNKPARIFGSTTSNIAIMIMRDGDVSAFTGTAYANRAGSTVVIFANLKLSSSALIDGTWTNDTGGSFTMRNCDSGNTTYKFHYEDPWGTLDASTSIYVGADPQFNNAGIGWTIVTTANANEARPFISPSIDQWTTATSAQTSLIQFAQASGATKLTDRDIWSSIEFANSASFPSYTYQTNRNAQPFTGTGANQPDSTATWTGLTTPVTQQLSNAFTASATGLLQSRVYISKASTTVYVSPSLEGVS